MREHAENAPLTFKLEGSTVPGHEGKHSLHFTRTFDSKCSQTNIESLTTEELMLLHKVIESYVCLNIEIHWGTESHPEWNESRGWEWQGFAVNESHPEWDACRRNASERA